jgi:hypothetical protein
VSSHYPKRRSLHGRKEEGSEEKGRKEGSEEKEVSIESLRNFAEVGKDEFFLHLLRLWRDAGILTAAIGYRL